MTATCGTPSSAAHASTPPTTLPSRLDASSLPFAGDRERRAVERGFEPDRFGDRVETGHELRADRGETARETAGRAAAGRAR